MAYIILFPSAVLGVTSWHMDKVLSVNIGLKYPICSPSSIPIPKYFGSVPPYITPCLLKRWISSRFIIRASLSSSKMSCSALGLASRKYATLCARTIYSVFRESINSCSLFSFSCRILITWLSNTVDVRLEFRLLTNTKIIVSMSSASIITTAKKRMTLFCCSLLSRWFLSFIRIPRLLYLSVQFGNKSICFILSCLKRISYSMFLFW